MRKKAIVAGITDRDGVSHIPGGESRLNEGDTVLVAALHNASDLIQHLFG